jgi:hypothetical protein
MCRRCKPTVTQCLPERTFTLGLHRGDPLYRIAGGLTSLPPSSVPGAPLRTVRRVVYEPAMDRNEAPAQGTINAVNKYGGIEVQVYLTVAEWQELLDAGSAELTQAYREAPSDAPVVRVTIRRPR